MRSTRLAALVAVLLLVLPACSQIRAQLDGAQVMDEEPRQSDTQPLLEVIEWADLDGLVSVLVRNNSDRILTRAEAVITLRNEQGVAVGGTTATSFEGSCCTALDVPPQGQFGFYVVAGEQMTAATTVDVSYKNVSWSPGGNRGGPLASIEPANLFSNDIGSVVSADVTTKGGPIEAAVVQAVVNGPDGEFLTVISGTWFCFVPGTTRRIWMQLYQLVPDGSTIDSMTVYPRPEDMAGGDANPTGGCDPESPRPADQS